MKRRKQIGVVILILMIVYFVSDRQLFYYGKSDFIFYNSLPFKIKPEYNFDLIGKFVLWNSNGLALAGKGVSVGEIGDSIYQNDIINNLIKYGFNDTSLVAFIKDTAGNNYYIEYFRNHEADSMSGITSRVIKANDSLNIPLRKWIDVSNIAVSKYVNSIELCRNYSLFIGIILFLILLYSSSRKIILDYHKHKREK